MQTSEITEQLHHYLRQGGYVFARLCLLVCLYVCLCVSQITQKLWTDLSEILKVCREWHKLPVIPFQSCGASVAQYYQPPEQVNAPRLNPS